MHNLLFLSFFFFLFSFSPKHKGERVTSDTRDVKRTIKIVAESNEISQGGNFTSDEA